jgi:murein DD-endopeptidase MepM/ murein hydrolase activator NlpD
MAPRIITPVRLIFLGLIFIGLLFTTLLVVVMDDTVWIPPQSEVNQETSSEDREVPAVSPTPTVELAGPTFTPTPDAPHQLPPIRTESEQYIVQPKDSLGQIAQRYFVSVEAILAVNEISQPDYLEVGQELTIPAPKPEIDGPGYKIIPDSELIYSPSSVDFNLAKFIHNQGGYLSSYKEEVDERKMSGVKIVQRVASEFSVNPKLLLSILEYQSGWLTDPNPEEATLDYPIGVLIDWREGLYQQLAWAADNLNRGYYLWRVNGLATWTLADGSIASINPSINAGTAGVQQIFAQLLKAGAWEDAVGPDGFSATHIALFGYPFGDSIEPLLPDGLTQPLMQLPFEPGVSWAFTGGPHGGWGSGSAWAGIDFAPPGEALGCVKSNAWIVAVADGLVLRAADGIVIQDLDNDGLAQTGWTVLYLHVDTRARVRPGTFFKAGARIGHPSCEGGFSTGTHLHLARRYNGEWIPADQDLPFILDGWTTQGLGREYDGYLVRDDVMIEAWEGRRVENEIQR